MPPTDETNLIKAYFEVDTKSKLEVVGCWSVVKVVVVVVVVSFKCCQVSVETQ